MAASFVHSPPELSVEGVVPSPELSVEGVVPSPDASVEGVVPSCSPASVPSSDGAVCFCRFAVTQDDSKIAVISKTQTVFALTVIAITSFCGLFEDIRCVRCFQRKNASAGSAASCAYSQGMVSKKEIHKNIPISKPAVLANENADKAREIFQSLTGNIIIYHYARFFNHYLPDSHRIYVDYADIQ